MHYGPKVQKARTLESYGRIDYHFLYTNYD